MTRTNFNSLPTGETSDDSSYVIGNYKSDKLTKDLLNLNDMITPREDDPLKKDAAAAGKAQLSKALLGKVLSPTKEKLAAFGTTPSALDGTGPMPNGSSEQSNNSLNNNTTTSNGEAEQVDETEKVNGRSDEDGDVLRVPPSLDTAMTNVSDSVIGVDERVFNFWLWSLISIYLFAFSECAILYI